jgi:alkyl hydroperoxide reductase subunit AhpC
MEDDPVSENSFASGEGSAIIGEKAPDFTVKAFQSGEVGEVSLSRLRGKWVVLFFYPADFTFVCPTELGELADAYAELHGIGVEVLSVWDVYSGGGAEFAGDFPD